MWVESVVLEHHGDVPVLWWNVGDFSVSDVDATLVDLFKASEHS